MFYVNAVTFFEHDSSVQLCCLTVALFLFLLSLFLGALWFIKTTAAVWLALMNPTLSLQTN